MRLVPFPVRFEPGPVVVCLQFAKKLEQPWTEGCPAHAYPSPFVPLPPGRGEQGWAPAVPSRIQMFLQILRQRARNRFLAHRRLLHLPVRRHEVASMPASLDLLQVIGDDEIAPVEGEEVECDLPQLFWGFADLELEAYEERIWGQLLCQLHGL